MKLFPEKMFPATAAVVLLVSCAGIPADGDAVQCDACRDMWIYLSSSTPAPGLYRLDGEGDERPVCPHCQEMAIVYFEGGALPRRCPECGGHLQARAVDIVR